MKAVNSKTVVSALAIAALLATPAFAKTRKHHPAPAAATQDLYDRVDSNTVVGMEGKVIGADPDVQIRAYLLRDEPSRLSGE